MAGSPRERTSAEVPRSPRTSRTGRAETSTSTSRLEDLTAMKLRAIGGRGELRDYFDLMTIEGGAGISAEEGLGLYVARYHPRDRRGALEHLVRALGYLEDVADDPSLPASRGAIERYWHRRAPDVARSLSTWAL